MINNTGNIWFPSIVSIGWIEKILGTIYKMRWHFITDFMNKENYKNFELNCGKIWLIWNKINVLTYLYGSSHVLGECQQSSCLPLKHQIGDIPKQNINKLQRFDFQKRLSHMFVKVSLTIPGNVRIVCWSCSKRFCWTGY